MRIKEGGTEIGLITFFSSQHAVQAEYVLSNEGLSVELIPGPKEISPNCGVALKFDYQERENAVEILKHKKVKYEAVHSYIYFTEKKTFFSKFWGE